MVPAPSSGESFFASVPDSPSPDEADDLINVDDAPPWAGPPAGIGPGVVALSVELGRSDSTVVLVEGARAYADGVVLRVVVAVRELRPSQAKYLFDQLDVTHGRGNLHLLLPQGGLRWGLEFSDGSKVTTLDAEPWVEIPDGVDAADWTPEHPILDGLGRPARYGTLWSREVWLWPLPPAGTIRAVCAWPDRGIVETETTIDATPLRAAAARATGLWT